MRLIQLFGNDQEPQALYSYPTNMTLDEAEEAITECLAGAKDREDELENTDEDAYSDFNLLDAAENDLELKYNIRRIYLDEMTTDLL
jgi:hypothetical protein